MLGEKLGEVQGKVTGNRILPGDDYCYIKLEISIQEEGTLLGMPVTQMGTYTAFERVPGQLYGEGQGIIMTAEGDSAIWNGHGVGQPTGEGMGVRFRASVAFQAGQGKLARLNNVLVLVEHETDGQNNTKTGYWEWK